MAGYRDLVVWQNAKSLAVEIYKLTSTGEWSKDWGLRDQIRGAAVSVPSNIAEGDARAGDKESIRFFRIALGSIAELETQLDIAREIDYLSQKDLQALLSQTELLAAKLGALIRARTPKN